MKLRIKSHSVRFRITFEEAEQLQATGQLLQETRVPLRSGDVIAFQYKVEHSPDAARSELEVLPFGMRLVLDAMDFAELADATKEGVYIRRPWVSESDQQINFIVYIEKDKPKRQKKKDGTNPNNKIHDTAHPEVSE